MKAKIPFPFVLDELSSASPFTKPMFGCTAIYLEDKIVLVLRDRETHSEDNGIWIVTGREHHESLRQDFPPLRSIRLLKEHESNWRVLPASDPNFEELAFAVCRAILKKDPRIGKVPEAKRPRKKRASKAKPNSFRAARPPRRGKMP